MIFLFDMVGRPVRLKNIQEFRKLKNRVKPVTMEELDKRLHKMEEKVHGLEMMIFRTRATFINKREKAKYGNIKS